MDCPLVFFSLLVKDKEYCLETWIQNFESLDYPKHRIILYIRANNCKDNSIEILKKWTQLSHKKYALIIENYIDIHFDFSNLSEHQWTKERNKIIGEIRNESFRVCQLTQAEYYFTYDVDNFVIPETLISLLSWKKLMVAPFLIVPKDHEPKYNNWGNYFHKCNEWGFAGNSVHHLLIFQRKVTGLLKMDLVHCSYLIHTSILHKLKYTDSTENFEFIIFSRMLKFLKIDQYLDNTKIYGCVIANPEYVPKIDDFLKMVNL